MPAHKPSNSRRPYHKPPNGTVVLPSGPQPADILLLGEAPGEAEALGSAPFIGPSGVQNDWYLSLFKLHSHNSRKSNIFWEYYDKNPDPSEADLARYRSLVVQDIWTTRPKLIIALGAFAMRFLLGSKASLDACHSLVHNPGHFDPSLASQCPPETKIIVGHHPAYGLHQPTMKPIIYGDYEQISQAIKTIRAGRDLIPHPYDSLADKELYLDVTGRELSQIIKANRSRITTLGLDTEGSPWSLQISFEDGVAYCLRASQPDLSTGISDLQSLVLDPKVLTITHCASTPDGTMIDISVCAKMGLDLRRANIRDTMYDAYLRRTIFKGLKPISYRYSSGLLSDYMSLVRGAATPIQAEYYHTILRHNWPTVERHVVEENDGTWRLYKPKPLNGIIKGILQSFETGKVNKDGKPTDLEEKWKDLLPQYRQFIEAKLGPFPFSSLDHIPLDKAVHYACLSNESLVETEEGPRKMGELVRKRYGGRVWSVGNDGKRYLKHVTGWYKNGGTSSSPLIEWWSVETEFSRFGRWGQFASRYTADHKLMTKDGWRKIEDLNSTDKIAIGVEYLSYQQRQLVIGSVLGDGSLSRRNSSGWVQFRISHAEKQKEYLLWKSKIAWGEPKLQLTKGGPISICGRESTRSDSYHFDCPSHPELINLRDSAYSGVKNEIVVSDWAETLDALGLAIWYQDDGTLVNNKYARIYTLAMKESSIQKLREILWINFGVESNSYIASGDYTFGGHVITIPSCSTDRFFSLIAPFIHPCLRYKLPAKFHRFDFVENVKNSETGQIFASVVRIFKNPYPESRRGSVRTTYCIDVEENHNFISVSGEVAHNCADADFTRRNLPGVIKDLAEHNLTQISAEGQYLLPIWYSAQSRGMPAKKAKVQSLIQRMNRICDETRSEISVKYFDSKPINPKSPPQVAKLIKHLGIDTSKLKRSKQTGDISTAKDSIEHLRWEHPAIDLVFRYREAQHYRDSFGKGYLNQFSPDEEYHWVKTVLDPAKIETRRLSSSRPNLLNVPSRTTLSKLVRGCFVAPEGWKFVSVDFSQIELRVMAHLSRDPVLTQIFLDNRDPHREWTRFLFGKEEVTDLERKFGKKIQFAMGYGRTPLSILQDLWQEGQSQWTLEPVVNARNAWFKRYLGVTKYRDCLIEEVRRSIVVHDEGGMPRYLPNIKSYKKYEREEAERQVFSHKIQGTAQTIIQRAMCYLRPIFESFEDNQIPIYLLLQIHDELLMLAQDDYVDLAGSVVQDAFMNHAGMSLTVPIVSEIEIGQSWDTLKESVSQKEVYLSQL